VAGAGDVNGDGYADVIVGADNFDAGEADEGAAFVFHGGASGISTGSPAATQLVGGQFEAIFGKSVASAGDVNADGYADVIVGARFYDDGQSNEGAAFVFLGSASGIASGSAAAAATELQSDQADAEFGWSVASAGDVNGDGYADVIVSALRYDPGPVDVGAAFVFLGSATGVANGNPATAAAQIDGSSGQIYSVASAGDVNGDGYADVIVGDWNLSNPEIEEGAAFVFLGGGDGDGRPVLARQLRGGGSTRPVQPWGASYHDDEFQVRLTATHPEGRGRVKLEVEACPAGVDFFAAGCVRRISSSWTDVTATSTGVTLTETVSGLAADVLYRWRARVLHAPFGVTQPGITAPPNPAHGPWRRLFGQSTEGDLRALLDTDGDGLANELDPDDDGDGLLDLVETDTGIFVSPADTGTDPLDPDSDDDGLSDGNEVLAVVTDPNDPDHDDDTFCDGAGTGGGACTAGDNCPAVANAGQANSDALPAGDACQCGDLDFDGTVDGLDVQIAREHVVGATISAPGFDLDRCNVVGPRGAGGGDDCDVADVYVLRRLTAGEPVVVQDACHAYAGP
jgi:hypothetical protein